MARKRSDRKAKRRSTARRRARNRANSAGHLNVPAGMQFFNPKPGRHTIDIIPYKVKQAVPALEIEAGEEHFEKTYYVYRRVGAEEITVVCPSKTFGHRDPIQEYRNRLSDDPESDPEAIKKWNPKERQLFLVYDHADKDAGLQVWDESFHLFGKLLDSRIANSDEEEGYDEFYFTDEGEGMTLKITVEESSTGKYKFNEVTAIDFKPRKEPLPEELLENVPCLDDFPREMSYRDLKKLFLQLDDDELDEEGNVTDEDEDGYDEEPPKPRRGKKPKDEEPEDEDDGDENDQDEEPEKPKRDKPKPKRGKPKRGKPKDEEPEDDGEDDEDAIPEGHSVCTACKGKGKSSKGRKCRPCGGTGYIEDEPADDDDDDDWDDAAPADDDAPEDSDDDDDDDWDDDF